MVGVLERMMLLCGEERERRGTIEKRWIWRLGIQQSFFFLFFFFSPVWRWDKGGIGLGERERVKTRGEWLEMVNTGAYLGCLSPKSLHGGLI